jgi:hypothetical protein
MEDAKRAKIIARTLAVLDTALGIYFVCIIIFSLANIITSFDNLYDFIFLFVFPIPFFIFGLYCIYSGCRLWLMISPENVRRVLFVSSIIFFFILVSFFPKAASSTEVSAFLTLLFMMPAGIFYILSNRLFLKALRLPAEINWTQREKSARRFFGWFSFFLLSAACRLLMIYIPPEKDTFLHLPTFICTIILSFAVYKLGIKIALWNKPKQAMQRDNSGECIISPLSN